MTKATLTLSADPSKQEEIDFFEAVAERVRVPADSYLRDFFTPDLIGWVTSQIRSDVKPDLWGWYMQTIDDGRIAADLVHKAEAKLVQANEAHNNAVLMLNERLREAIEQSTDRARKIDDLIGRCGEAMNERDMAEDKIVLLENRIKQLKAEIYDLEHKE